MYNFRVSQPLHHSTERKPEENEGNSFPWNIISTLKIKGFFQNSEKINILRKIGMIEKAFYQVKYRN